jgi:formate hydrogenlyase subunit 4
MKSKVKRVGRLVKDVTLGDDKFFRTVQTRVAAYLKEHSLTEHSGELLGLVEVSMTVLLYTLLSVYVGVTASYWAAAALGIVSGRMGFWMHMVTTLS